MAVMESVGKLWFTVYYPYSRLLTRLLPWVQLDGKRIRVFPSVHKPMDNVQAVVHLIPPGRTVLDLGCGCGVLSVFAAAKSREVTAVDINPEAIANTRENVRLHHLSNVRAICGDMFAEVTGDFDVIVSNPPFVPLEFSDPARQWATSKTFLSRLFASARRFLSPTGQLMLVWPASQRERLRVLAEANGLQEVDVSTVPKQPRRLALVSMLYFQFIPPMRVFTYRA